MAHVIHELRTPLNGIIGMLDLIEPEDLPSPKDTYLSEAKRSSATLLALVNDLLDASKIHAGEMAVEKVPFDLPGLIDEIGTSHVKTACEKELRLSLVVGEDVPDEVYGDPLRLKQVITNLLTNALKFTETGEITVQVSSVRSRSSETAEVEFRVTDTGIGISDEQQERIFKPFSQAESSTTRKYGGTGLGLPICAELVKLMGGDLEIQSEPDGGSSFSFVIPFDLFGTQALESSAPRTRPRRRALSEDRAIRPRSNVKILVAEDNEVNRMVVMEHLRLLGYEAQSVVDGQAALDALKPGHGYSVVLMDGQMPILDGYQATELVRERESSSGARRVAVIALTAHAMQHDRARAIAAGMDDYLSKPYTLDDLREVIELWAKDGAAPTGRSQVG